MTCERCIHYDICNEHADGQLLELAQGVCFRFKDKESFVSVVRCKDCKYYEIHSPRVLENCERNGKLIPMSPYDFCSCGERKDDE